MELIFFILLAIMFLYLKSHLEEKGCGGCLAFSLTLVFFLVILLWTWSRF